MILVNTDYISGKELEMLGLVKGSTIQSKHLGKADLITIPGVVNADFADIETVMLNKGLAHMGVGVGTGDNKAQDAVRQAISSPLLETSIDGATGVIINSTR